LKVVIKHDNQVKSCRHFVKFFEAEFLGFEETPVRFPLKCYCYASSSALQNSITAAIGARLEKRFFALKLLKGIIFTKVIIRLLRKPLLD